MRLFVGCMGAHANMRVEYVQGDESDQVPPSPETFLAAMEYRSLSWSLRSGAWYSIELQFDRATSMVEVHMNWDREVSWLGETPSAQTHYDDLLAFPRHYEMIPAWHPAHAVITERGWNEYLALRGLV